VSQSLGLTSRKATVVRRFDEVPRVSGRGWIYRLSREPLIHFVLLGTIIFVIAHVERSEQSLAAQRIVVGEQLQRRIVELSQSQSGVTPGRDQLELLTQEYINDEVLYREALRLGLDRDDEIVRRRLIQKMQFLQRDLAGVPKPGERELRAYYDAHPALFNSPASVAFEQLYFSADRGGWTEAEARARRAYEALGRSAGAPPPESDDAFPLQIPPGNVTAVEAGRLFGETPIVDALFKMPEGHWSVPVRSAYGWHLVKTSKGRLSSTAPFAEVRDQVESAYLEEQTKAAERHELEGLRARYQVLRPGKPSIGSS